MNRNELLEELENSTKELLDILRSFDSRQINKIPFEGSWSAGQVAEHLLKAESGVPGTLTGPVKPVERPGDEKIPAIEAVFLDFSTKLKSPEFILPGPGPHEKETLLRGFDVVRKKIDGIGRSADLTMTCTGFSLPQMGELTRLEWIHFVVCHSRRHVRQMERIRRHVT